MAVPQNKFYMTVEEYLEFEKTSNIRHEYVDGAVYAMGDESKRHNRIGGQILAVLLRYLDESNFNVYFEKVKLRGVNTFYYPDVVVVCEADDEDEYVLENPRLIVEVLSPTTQRTDRAEKLIAYQKIESLQEYVIVAQDRIWIQIHRRGANDNWAVENFLDLEGEITFASVSLKMKVADVYRNVRFPAPESEVEL
jgi:Uma2 family endonuclease